MSGGHVNRSLRFALASLLALSSAAFGADGLIAIKMTGDHAVVAILEAGIAAAEQQDLVGLEEKEVHGGQEPESV